MKYLKYFKINESIDSILPSDGGFTRCNIIEMSSFDSYFKQVAFEDIIHYHKYMESISLKLESPRKFDSETIIMFFHGNDGGSMRVQLIQYEDDYFVVKFVSDSLKIFFICDTEEGLVKFVDEFDSSWI